MICIIQAKIGRKAAFRTPDEAALAFAHANYPFTQTTGRECGAHLYSEIITGQLHYYFDDFRYGKETSVTLPAPDITEKSWTVGGRTYVGNIHTHAPGWQENNRFSGNDIAIYRQLLRMKPPGYKFAAYLVAPNGMVFRYDPETDSEIEIGRF